MRVFCALLGGLLLLGAYPRWAEADVRVISDDREAKKPVQLTAESFDTEISAVPASYSLLVEFYAHWYVRSAQPGCN